MNYYVEWGVTPVNEQGIDPLILDSLDFEAKNLSQAKGQSLKLVKACPKVIDYFSSESEDWDPSESRWEDWQPTADSADRPGFKYTSRQSEDLCVKSLAGASCRVYMILSWRDKKAAAEAIPDAVPGSVPAEEATADA